jgi:hypothetical protein
VAILARDKTFFDDDDDLYACVYKEKKQNSPFQMFIDAPS